jgi:pimeloyl-ACP methyl ester carboxylesterase
MRKYQEPKSSSRSRPAGTGPHPLLRRVRWAGMVAASLGLVACGIKDETLVIRGTAAIGTPMQGTVTAMCKSGQASAAADEKGDFTLVVARGVAPCLLEMVLPDSAARLHSVAIGEGSNLTANISPLTDMLVTFLMTGIESQPATPREWFARPDTQGELARSAAMRKRIVDHFIPFVETRSTSFGLQDEAFLTRPFKAQAGDAVDDALERLRVQGLVKASGKPADDTVAGLRQAAEAAVAAFVPGMCDAGLDFTPRPAWERRCGTVKVRQARQGNPASGSERAWLALYVEEHRPQAAAPSQGLTPWVYLTGGSGLSLRSYLDIGILPKLLAWSDRPVILVEQRGNLLSNAMTLGEEALGACADDAEIAEDAGSDEESAAAQACAERLREGGVVLEALNSVETADDIAVVIAALGHERVHLWGHSYGAGLAQRVAQRHGARVEGMVLEGVADPRGPQAEGDPSLLDVAAEFTTWFNPRCATDGPCRVLFPQGLDGGQALSSLFFDLAEDPQIAVLLDEDEGLILTGQQLLVWALSGGQGVYEGMLTFMQTLHGFQAHRRGQPEVLEQLLERWGDGDRTAGVLGLLGTMAKLNQETPSFELSHAVKTCFDVRTSWEEGDNVCLRLGLDPSRYPAGATDFVPTRIDIPTLFLQGRLDTQTPLSEAQGLAESFSKLRTVTFGQCIGHMPFRDAGDCGQEVLHLWLADPQRTPAPACMATVCDAKSLLPSGAMWDQGAAAR